MEQYTKAAASDYEEVIDLANYVFSQSSIPHDFPAFLPKLYKRAYFMDGTHYLVKEDGRIRAVVGAYPLTMRLAGEALPGRGIGMVAVHPYSRSRGYMRTLMAAALADMRSDGIVWSALGGRRQRYEYFGYTPTGTTAIFTCDIDNIRHALAVNNTPRRLSLRQVTPDDATILDGIYRLHHAKSARFERPRERLFDILVSWKSRVFAVLDGNNMVGYCVLCQNIISEIALVDPGQTLEVLGLAMGIPGVTGTLRVKVRPSDRETVKTLLGFAESCACENAYSFNILDYRRMLTALVRFKETQQTISDGSVTFRIDDGPALCIAVEGGAAAVTESAAVPAFTLTHLEAMRFFFSFMPPPAAAHSPFLQSLLPLPLFFDLADEV